MIRRNPKTIILLGISGSGKGVQARLIRAVLRGSKIISTGDGLRRAARRRNRIGRYISGILRRGDIAPYWAAAHVWLLEFFDHLKGDEPLVFDGAPRRTEEARMLDMFMRDVDRPKPLAIYLRLSPEAARKRLLKRGRSDDNPRAIQERFQFFERSVRPVIRYYQRRRRLVTINGDQPIDAVWRDIRKALLL